jgi:hypothetical protein
MAPVAPLSLQVLTRASLGAFRFIGFRNKDQCILGIMQPQIEAETDVSKRDCSGSFRFFIGTRTKSPTNIKKSYRLRFPKKELKKLSIWLVILQF